MNENKFLGSRAEGETEIEHAAREAEYKEQNSCPLCKEFECDGYCEQEEWDSYDMETQGFDVPDMVD